MKIDYEELQMAMNTHDPMGLGRHYFDTETGEVLYVSDWAESEARRERWFAFSAQRWRKRIDDWLRVEGVPADD